MSVVMGGLLLCAWNKLSERQHAERQTLGGWLRYSSGTWGLVWCGELSVYGFGRPNTDMGCGVVIVGALILGLFYEDVGRGDCLRQQPLEEERCAGSPRELRGDEW